jgi:peptide chain release factor 1
MQYAKKLDQIEKHFEELTAQMADPAVISDGDQYRKVSKAHSDLSDIVAKYRDTSRMRDSWRRPRPCWTESDPTCANWRTGSRTARAGTDSD